MKYLWGRMLTNIKTIEFPCECQYLNATTHLNSNFIFDDHTYYKYIIIGSIMVMINTIVIETKINFPISEII